MLTSLRQQLLLAAIAGGIFFVNLGATHLWDVDEAIFTQAAKEMFQRGDAVTPYFNGEVFPDKPALMYWMMMAGFELFGTTEFAARFFSAIFGIGSVLLTYRLGRLVFSPAVGFWGALALATSINFCVIARAATPDAYLVFFSTLAMLLFVAGTAKARPLSGELNERNAPWAGQTRFEPSWTSWLLVYAAMALGFLTKGPIGVVLPTASIGLFLLIMRAEPVAEAASGWRGALGFALRSCRTVLAPVHVLKTIWSMRPLSAVATLLLVAGPWYVWVGIETGGEWPAGFFGVHNFGRFVNAMDNHRGPVFYYLIAVAIGFFPWSVLAWPTLVEARKLVRERHPWRPGYVLVGSWAAVWIGFFSIAGTKLPSYVVPAYPAIALATACLVARWVREPATLPRLSTRLAWGCVAMTGVGLIVALPIAAHVLLGGEWFLGAIGILPLVAAVVGWIASERSQSRYSAATLAALGVALPIAVLGFAAVYVDRYQESPAFAARITAGTPQGAQPAVGSFRHFRPSYVYYTDEVVEKFVTPEEVQGFFAAHPQGAFVITNDGQFEHLRGRLPPGVAVLEERRRLGQEGSVLLLGRSAVVTAKAPGDSSASR
jgi:4-amino-4-deoxy-L-arabinose transferase-like glycosyltransferase